MEIKFRAWDSYQNKMYEWVEICKMDENGSLTLSNLLNNLIEHIKPIQFTGLHDKNSKESYHKDIIQDCLTKANYVIEYGKYQLRVGTGFGWYLSGINVESRTFPTDLEDFVIVGNVFEGNIYEKSDYGNQE